MNSADFREFVSFLMLPGRQDIGLLIVREGLRSNHIIAFSKAMAVHSLWNLRRSSIRFPQNSYLEALRAIESSSLPDVMDNDLFDKLNKEVKKDPVKSQIQHLTDLTINPPNDPVH